MTEFDPATEPVGTPRPTVAELFAGVGGFHLALDRAGFDVVWSNQWEPSTKAQQAFECYEQHVRNGDFQRFGRELRGAEWSEAASLGLVGHQAVNEDIAKVLDKVEAQVSGPKKPVFPVLPDVDVLVGGFPCQDYSVAKTLRQAHGLVGHKGVLWWEIHRLLRLKVATGRPIRYLFLENVDRLLKSPSGQRGRDFAVMLASLADLGYEVAIRPGGSCLTYSGSLRIAGAVWEHRGVYHLHLTRHPRKVLVAVDTSFPMQAVSSQVPGMCLQPSGAQRYTLFSLITDKDRPSNTWQPRLHLGHLQPYAQPEPWLQMLDQHRYPDIVVADQVYVVTNAASRRRPGPTSKRWHIVQLQPTSAVSLLLCTAHSAPVWPGSTMRLKSPRPSCALMYP